jgi:hypothetical protein
MCVAAIPAIGGLAAGSQSGLFLASLGIQGAQMLQRNRAARQAANYQYEAARRSALSAERAFAQQQEGLAANLKETRAAKAQERLAATVQGQQARGAIAATEGLSGRTASLLSRDAARQQANLRNSINQTMASATGQYRRNALGLLAQRDSRRNAATDMQNQAYATARQNSSGIFDFLGAGLQTYTGLLGQA